MSADKLRVLSNFHLLVSVEGKRPAICLFVCQEMEPIHKRGLMYKSKYQG